MEHELKREIEHSRRRSDGNSQRLLDLTVEFHKLADRLHTLEDKFDNDGIVQQLSESLYLIAEELEKVKIALKAHIEDGTHGTSGNPS